MASKTTTSFTRRVLGRLGLAAVAAVCLLVGALGTAAAQIQVAERVSPGGIAFWHVEEQSIPMVAFEARFRGGAALDAEGKDGTARMVMALLDEGAGARDASAFAAEAESLAARFGFDAGRDTVSVSARMLAENLDASAALLAEALSAPRLDDEAVARVRTQLLSSIASDETDPQSLARDAFYARAFAGHPYARRVDGTAESVGALSVEDLRAGHARAMTRDRAIVAVVGAVDGEAAGALVDTIMAGLPAGEGDIALPPLPVAEPPAGIDVIDLAVPQSVAVFGQVGLPREDPDYIPAYVMNYVLGGGGFASRLMTEVREKRGLAYGVYSYLTDLDGAPLYIGGVSTANERIAESLEVIRAEWTRMAEEGVGAEELEKAKRYLTGAFPLRFDTNAKIARFLVAAQQAGLEADYVQKRNGLIEAVTAEDIARIAARLLRPEALSVTVVGQPAGL